MGFLLQMVGFSTLQHETIRFQHILCLFQQCNEYHPDNDSITSLIFDKPIP